MRRPGVPASAPGVKSQMRSAGCGECSLERENEKETWVGKEAESRPDLVSQLLGRNEMEGRVLSENRAREAKAGLLESEPCCTCCLDPKRCARSGTVL